MVRNKANNESLTYGFVTYVHLEDAVRAMQALNGISVCGKHIKVSKARRRDADDKSCKLYVANVPLYYTSHNLNELFAQVSSSLFLSSLCQFGTIIELQLSMDEHGKSRKTAIIGYSCKKEADAGS